MAWLTPFTETVDLALVVIAVTFAVILCLQVSSQRPRVPYRVTLDEYFERRFMYGLGPAIVSQLAIGACQRVGLDTRFLDLVRYGMFGLPSSFSYLSLGRATQVKWSRKISGNSERPYDQGQ